MKPRTFLNNNRKMYPSHSVPHFSKKLGEKRNRKKKKFKRKSVLLRTLPIRILGGQFFIQLKIKPYDSYSTAKSQPCTTILLFSGLTLFFHLLRPWLTVSTVFIMI